MADNLGYTQGSGALIKTDQGSNTGAHILIAKLAESSDGGEQLIPATTAYGLSVDVRRVNGTVAVSGSVDVSDGGGSVSVDDGGESITIDGTVTAAQGLPGPLSAPWPVVLSDGSLAVSVKRVDGEGALRVAVVDQTGAATVNEGGQYGGTEAKLMVVGGAYRSSPSVLSDGEASSILMTQYRALHVNLRSSGGDEIGTQSNPIKVDVVGTTTQPVSGTVNATLSSSTNAGATAKKANFHTGSGTDEVTMFGVALPSGTGAVIGGTSANPIRVDPTGSTTQPVSGTVTANQGSPGASPWNVNLAQVGGASVSTVAAGVQKVGLSDSQGNAISAINPFEVMAAPAKSGAWRQSKTYAASETAVSIKAPSGGKTLVVEGLIIVASAAGIVKVFDGTDSDSTTLFRGTIPAGVHVVTFPSPQKLSAVNNVLRYSTGTGAGGDITAFGYEV